MDGLWYTIEGDGEGIRPIEIQLSSNVLNFCVKYEIIRKNYSNMSFQFGYHLWAKEITYS